MVLLKVLTSDFEGEGELGRARATHGRDGVRAAVSFQRLPKCQNALVPDTRTNT